MPQRRINDAQVERLLEALHSLPYRQHLARQIAVQENIQYASAMRRLQRYITEAGERRVFAHSPAPKRQALRAAARQVPQALRPAPKPRPIPTPEPIRPYAPPPFFKEIPAAEIPADYVRFSDRAPQRDITAYDYWGVVAYHDGDQAEAVRELGLSRRADSLLRIATTGDGVDIKGSRGSGEVDDAILDFYADHEDAQDVEDFTDLLHNLPDWNIGLIMADISSGQTTFADWLDSWRADHMVYRHYGDPDDLDLEDSEYWELWRAAYSRATA